MAKELKSVRVRDRYWYWKTEGMREFKVTCFKKTFGKKYEVIWQPLNGGESTKFEFDADDDVFSKETKDFFPNIAINKIEYFKMILSPNSGEFYQEKWAYGLNGEPNRYYLLSQKEENTIVYGFNPANYSEADIFINEAIQFKRRENEQQLGYPESFDVVSDPWTETPPMLRNFSDDPYYVNNGAQIRVVWTERRGSISAGGRKWSSLTGDELLNPILYPFQDKQDGDDKTNLQKRVEVIGETGTGTASTREIIYYNEEKSEGKKFTKEFDWGYWGGLTDDETVLYYVLKEWNLQNKKVNSNAPEVKICSPSNIKCELIPYISPLKSEPDPKQETGLSQSQTPTTPEPSIKLHFTLPYGEFKARTDLPKLEFYVGDPAVVSPGTFVPAEDGFVFDEENLEVLDEEYGEADFSGTDEEALELSKVRVVDEEELKKNIESKEDDPIEPNRDKPIINESGSVEKEKTVKEAIIIIMDTLIKDCSFSVEEAAGICGNIKAESGFKYWNVENGASNIIPGASISDIQSRWDRGVAKGYHYTGKDVFSGIGLAQWTFGRRWKMENYVGEYLYKKGVSNKYIGRHSKFGNYLDTSPTNHAKSQNDLNRVYGGAGDALETFLKNLPYLFEAQASFLAHEFNSGYSGIKNVFRSGDLTGNSLTNYKRGFFVNQSGGKLIKTPQGFAEVVVNNFEVPGPITGKNKQKYEKTVKERGKLAADCLVTYKSAKKLS